MPVRPRQGFPILPVCQQAGLFLVKVWRFLLAGSQQKTPHFHFRAPAAHERREWESPVHILLSLAKTANISYTR